MESTSKIRSAFSKKKIVVIAAIAAAVLLAAGSVTAALLLRGAADARRAEEAALRTALSNADTQTITLDHDVYVTEPLTVSGDKMLAGEGNILPESGKAGDAAARPGLLRVEPGASLTLSGAVTVDGDKRWNSIIVSSGAALTIQEKAVVRQGVYFNVQNDGTFTAAGGSLIEPVMFNIRSTGTAKLDGGAVTGSGKKAAAVYSTGKLELTKTAISAAAGQNVWLGSGASLVMSGGSVADAEQAGIYAESGATVTLTGGSVTGNSQYGLRNLGTADVTGVTITGNGCNIRNEGGMKLYDMTLQGSVGNSVSNGEKGSMTLRGVEIFSSGAAALENLRGGTLDVADLTIRRTGTEGIRNLGGTLIGRNVTIFSCGTIPLKNMPGDGASGGDVTLDNLTVSGASGMNVVQSSSGVMTLTNSSIGLTTVTSVRIIAGTMKLDNVTVEGTTGTGAGIWITGGALDIQNSTIKDTKGRGMAIAGGTVVGKNLKLSNIANVGIDNMPNNDGYSTGSAEIDGLTITGGTVDNIANTGGGTMKISNAVLGKTTANSIRVVDGHLLLTNVDIQGTGENSKGETSFHGVYLRGGRVTMTDVDIRDCIAGGIRNRGGEVNGTDVRIANTGGAAVSNGTYSDGSYGNITLSRLKVTGALLGNVLNECPGSLTVKDAVLGVCVGNSVMIKDGVMTVTDAEVKGTLAGATSAAHHGIYAPGGKLIVKNSTFSNAIASGIRNAGAEIVAENVTVSGSAANNVSASGGTTTLIGCTLNLSSRTNVNLTAAEATAVLKNTRVLGAGDASGANNVNAVYVAPKAKLTIEADTLITGSVTRAGLLNEGGTVVMNGGNITGNAQRGVNNANKTVGGTVYTASFTMNGGRIASNGNGTVSGGGIYNGGTVAVNGGEISRNIASTGGGINTADGSHTTIAAGTLSGNRATVEITAKGNGGGIHVSTGANVVITGGTLTGNTAEGVGDAICHNGNSLILGGSAVIDSGNDVYLASSSKFVQVRGGTFGNTAGNPLTLTVSSEQYGTVAVKTDSADVVQAIRASVALTNENIHLVKYGADLAVGDQDDNFNFVARIGNQYYISLQAAFDAVPTTGEQTTIEILRDIELSAMVDIGNKDSGKNIVLTDDGNGPYTISRAADFTAGRMILLRKNNTMVIRGSSGSDTEPSLIIDGMSVKAAKDSQMLAIGASTANYNATAVMEAGVRLQNGCNTNGGGAVIVNGTLTMKGGVIAGNTSPDLGGGIYVGNVGVLTVEGGRVAGNSGGTGQDVYVAGKLRIGGSGFIGGIYLPKGKTVQLTAALTAATTTEPMVITMPAYAGGTQVLSGEASLLASEYGKFALANPDATLNAEGKIDGTAVYVAKIGTTRYTSLQEAINAVPTDGTQTTIQILRDIELSAMVDIGNTDSGKNIVLTDDGNGPYTISRAAGFTTGRMILLRKNNTMVIRPSSADDTAPSLIFDGKGLSAGNDTQILAVGASTSNWDATMTIEAGLKLQNGKNANGGGAVIVNGTLTMKGGVITGSESGQMGGGIYIGAKGTLMMTGGSVTGSLAPKGKGIYNAGTLSLGGAAAVDEVYLPSGKTLTVSAAMTAATAAEPIVITMPAYVDGTQVLSGETSLLSSEYGKFALADSNATLNAEGKIEG